MNEMNKDALIENLEQMEQETENMEDELDRTLGTFKNMELDQKLESLEDQLKDLQQNKDKLNELTDDKKISPEELSCQNKIPSIKSLMRFRRIWMRLRRRILSWLSRDLEFEWGNEQAIWKGDAGESKENLEENTE